MANPTAALNITKREMDLYFQENEGLSDVQEAGVYDGIEYFPAIEWDGIYGKWWQHFDTEADMLERLHRYDMDICRWVIGYRMRSVADVVARNQAKRKAAYEKKVAKGLGGSFPVLQELLVAARKQDTINKIK